jgi:hypothetical protein
LSKEAHVDYYRCPRCAHVWATEKNSATVVRHVSALARPRIASASID